MPDTKVHVRVPLFDRLVSGDSGTLGSFSPPRTLDREGLIESVRRELERLFNTRAPLPAHELDARERTVVDYGIPDFSHLAPKRREDQARLIQNVKQAIEAYEPRLRHIDIAVEGFTKESQSFQLRIDAVLVVDNVRESISFRSVISSKRERAQIHVNG